MADRVIRGILGTKLGMTQVFDEANRVVPVTVVKAGPCVVTQVRTPDVDGYSAVQLAFGEIDPRKVPRPLRGHFEKAGVTPRRHVVELRTLDAASYPVGYELTAAAFSPGTVVDVIATSKGKGYAGVMKRHGFKGLGAGHGVEKKHRSPGSIGGCATPGRVFKGVKMAGRMGGERSTTHEPRHPRGRRRARPAARARSDPGSDRRARHGAQCRQARLSRRLRAGRRG